MTGVDIRAKCHKTRQKVVMSANFLHFSSFLAFVWACSSGCAAKATVQQTGGGGTAVQQQQPLPAAAASTGGRSAAESRTSLSRLCCSLLLRCHAAAAAAASSPTQTLARQQGNPSKPPPHHWHRLRRQVLCSAENCSAAATAELERQQSGKTASAPKSCLTDRWPYSWPAPSNRRGARLDFCNTLCVD